MSAGNCSVARMPPLRRQRNHLRRPQARQPSPRIWPLVPRRNSRVSRQRRHLPLRRRRREFLDSGGTCFCARPHSFAPGPAGAKMLRYTADDFRQWASVGLSSVKQYSGAVLPSRRLPYLACGIGIQSRNAESDNEIWPAGSRVDCDRPRRNDRDICQDIVTSRKKRSAREAAGMRSKSRQYERATEVDYQCASSGER